MFRELTIEFVKVAGTATNIHHPNPHKKSLPFPRTRLLTSLPSNSATYKLINVRSTKNTLWLINSLSSLLFHPGITIFSSRSRFLKNSRPSSTFLRFVTSPGPDVEVNAFAFASAARCDADFCSEMAVRTRCIRAMRRVRKTARDIRERCLR